MFADIYTVYAVGLDDDFFALGGLSLLAMRLLRRIRALWGVDLPIQALFEHSTVGDLADCVERSRVEAALDPVRHLRPGGDLPALFCVHDDDGLSWRYSCLLPHIGKDHSIYGLERHRSVDGASVTAQAAE